MKYSQLFAKTRKSIPSDATSINHQLLLKAGFVDQLAAGIFTWMPLGLRVLRNIERNRRSGSCDASTCPQG
jgi:prolyl-tRNA synthetase